MWLADPLFLRQIPPYRVQLFLLLMLIWVSMPLLMHMPVLIGVLFMCLWLMRVGLLLCGIQALPRWLLVMMMAVLLGVIYLKLGTVVGREGGVALLVLLIMLKAFESHALRDWQVLLLAQLMILGAVLLFDQSVWMAPWLLLSAFFFVTSLSLLAGITLRPALRQSVVILLLALPLTAVLFVIAPRRSSPLWHIPQPDQTVAKTGLTDTLKTGTISKLIQSDELAFNVQFRQQPAQLQSRDLYWRVMVMGQNEHQVWHAVDENLSDEDSIKVTQPENPAEQAAKLLDYQLILKDDHGRIPALDYPLSHLDSREISYRAGDVLRVNDSREGLRRIELKSLLTAQLPQILSNNELRIYRSLPAGMNPQTRALAKQLAQQSTSPADFVQRILNYFRNGHFV